jgi:hypothetical protein
MPGHTVSGWKLDRSDRTRLLQRFPPAYPDTVADHVTLQSGVDPHGPKPPAVEARIVGRADDGRGVQALAVEVDGTTDRPDGSTYHITWSLDREAGRNARESNDVLKAQGFMPLSEPIPIRLEPCLWKT